MIRQYIKLSWYNWAVKDELCEPVETKVLFLTACLFIIVLLPHLWRAINNGIRLESFGGGGACIDSWILQKNIVIHQCTGGPLHPYILV